MNAAPFGHFHLTFIQCHSLPHWRSGMNWAIELKVSDSFPARRWFPFHSYFIQRVPSTACTRIDFTIQSFLLHCSSIRLPFVSLTFTGLNEMNEFRGSASLNQPRSVISHSLRSCFIPFPCFNCCLAAGHSSLSLVILVAPFPFINIHFRFIHLIPFNFA